MDQLAALLEGHLKGHGAARAQCEAQLTALLRTPGFALQLCEFLFTVGGALVDPAHRQLASILLKKLVTSHWTPGATGDDEDSDEQQQQQRHQDHSAPQYLVPEDEKQRVRHAIVVSIQQSDVLAVFADSKLETALCMAITAIFERDWPDQWPELLPVVVQLVAGQSANASPRSMAFAIRFLALAGNHFSSEHCCELVSVVFPHLQRVFTARHEFSISVRTRVVRIVENSLQMVGMESQVGNATAQQLLHGNVSSWITLFLQELAAPVESVKHNALQIQILTTLGKFVEEWTKSMSDLLPQIVPQVHALLAGGVEAFDRDVVLDAEGQDDDAYDSDGEGTHIGRSAVAVAIFEFLKSTMQAPTKKTRQLIVGGLGDFVYVMIAYMQITASQTETWEEDPNKYVADEDDQSLAYNVRNAGTDLVAELESIGIKAVAAIVQAAQRQLSGGDASNWRRQEAALLVIGTVAPSILLALNKDAAALRDVFDLASFLQTLFTVMNSASEPIYLRARALWCASKLAGGMTTEMLHAFLQVAVSGLEQSQVLPVKLYACRAVGAILKHDAGKLHLRDASDVVVERLIHLTQLASTETLHIALETLVVVLQELPNLAPAAANATVACFLHNWGQHLNDPLVSELIDGAFGALLEYDNLEIVASLHAQVLPMIAQLLVQARSELGAAGNGATIAASAITVLKTIVKHSFITATSAGESAKTDPTLRAMRSQIVTQVFEPLVAVLEVVDDEKVLSAGAECLKWLVMFAVDVLAEFKCANGSSGVDATMQVAAKLLSPDVDESYAVGVGGLITQILLQLGSALPAETIQSILSAIGARLASAKLPSLVQSLCLVFARLVHTHGRDILDVLERLPSPSTAHPTMLAFVFSTWIEKQDEFYGLYCIKVTISALLKVAEWNDARATQLVVAGSEIPTADTDSGAGIQTRTRSKTAGSGARNKQQLTRVHFMTKLITVLAKVYTTLGDDEDEWEDSEEEDDESGDEDDTGAVAGGGLGGSIFAPAEQYELLSDRLDANANEDEHENVEEEFEAHFDPLNEVDLKALIPMAVTAVTADASLLQAILPELTPADKEVLAEVTGGTN